MTRIVLSLVLAAGWAAAQTGVFEGSTDIGSVLHPGGVTYDAGTKRYTVTGSGENMWFAQDQFHLAWKKVSGDTAIEADVAIQGEGGNAHRKGVLMVRQGIEEDSAYADVALHGDGLTSLQYRLEKGDRTREVQAAVSRPKRVRLEKRGDTVYLWVAGEDGAMRFAGGSTRLVLKDPYYVGIGACAHDKDAQVTVAFSNLELRSGARGTGAAKLYSTVETVPVSSTDRRAVYVAQERLGDANWSPDGAALVVRGEAAGGGARWLSVPAAGGAARVLEGKPEWVKESSGDHAQSPDGGRTVTVVYEDEGGAQGGFRAAVLEMVNQADEKTTAIGRLSAGPGTLGAGAWSPDGKRVAFVSYHWVWE